MNTTMRNVIDAIIYFILFYVIQIASSLVFTLIMGDCTQSLVLGLGTAAVITILLFHFARFSPLRSSYIKSRLVSSSMDGAARIEPYRAPAVSEGTHTL